MEITYNEWGMHRNWLSINDYFNVQPLFNKNSPLGDPHLCGQISFNWSNLNNNFPTSSISKNLILEHRRGPHSSSHICVDSTTKCVTPAQMCNGKGSRAPRDGAEHWDYSGYRINACIGNGVISEFYGWLVTLSKV